MEQVVIAAAAFDAAGVGVGRTGSRYRDSRRP
jgi:hypothetical protein